MDNIQNLLPFVFLIIWIIAALQGRKNKQKKEQQRLERRLAKPPARTAETCPRPSLPQEPRDSSRRAGSFLENIMRTIEETAKEFQQAPEQDLEPPAPDTTASESAAIQYAQAERAISGASKQEMPPPDYNALLEIVSTEQAEISVDTNGSILSLPIGKAGKKHHHDISSLRAAVIWSEILNPPIALRSQTAHD